MMTSDYIVNVARFWKKFVHCDGSYGAGGRQGRYVFSWPAVRRILLGSLFVPPRYDYCCALLSVTHSLTCVIQTWMMWPWLLKTPTLKIRQWWKNIRNSTVKNIYYYTKLVDVVTVADVNAEERVVKADFWSRLVIKQFFGEIIEH